MRAEQQWLRSALGKIEIEGVHVVTDGMELGMLRASKLCMAFRFPGLRRRRSDGEKDVFDLLEDLANQVVRAKRSDDPGQGEVDVVLRKRRLLCVDFRGGEAQFQLRLNM